MTTALSDFKLGPVAEESSTRGTADSGADSPRVYPPMSEVDRVCQEIMWNTQEMEKNGPEPFLKADFIADLKRVSKSLAPGPKLTREESMKRIDDKHGPTLEALGDE